MYPNQYVRPGLFASLRNVNWSGILDGTQKTLGVINQAIPIVYQVKPVVSNMRSLFKIANALNAPDTSSNNNKLIKDTTSNNTKSTNNSTRPVFYI